MDLINEIPKTRLIAIESNSLLSLIADLEDYLSLIGKRAPNQPPTFGTGNDGILAKFEFLRDRLDENVTNLKKLL